MQESPGARIGRCKSEAGGALSSAPSVALAAIPPIVREALSGAGDSAGPDACAVHETIVGMPHHEVARAKSLEVRPRGRVPDFDAPPLPPLSRRLSE